MARKVKEIDYLYTSARVRAMEHALLNPAKTDRMLSARTPEEAAAVLTECGYPELKPVTAEAVRNALDAQRKAVYETLYAIVPDPSVLDVFKIKYDYHNVKVLLKAEAMGEPAGPLLTDLGRVPADRLAQAVSKSEFQFIPGVLPAAISEARNTLGSTRDPQLTDIVLDRACFQDMLALARETKSRFLIGYVRLLIDIANLGAVVRTLRRHKGTDFLTGVLIPGGEIDKGRILSELTAKGTYEGLYAVSPLREAAEAGKTDGSLTRFETLCDTAAGRYLRTAQYISIGEAPVIRYLGAKEAEFIAVRIILSGFLAGLKPDEIRERLREAYV